MDTQAFAALLERFTRGTQQWNGTAFAACFTEDGIYHNIPVEPMVGHEAIRMMIDGFTAGLKVKIFRIDTMLSKGSTVVTERVDIFEKEDGTEISLPVLGIFEFEWDKIAKWREYFDLNQFMNQMG